MKTTFLAVFLLCAASAFAQGTIRFDWVDNYYGTGGPIQASLTLDASVMQHPNSDIWPRSDPGAVTAPITGLTVTTPDISWPPYTAEALWPPSTDHNGQPYGNYFDASGNLHLFVLGNISIVAEVGGAWITEYHPGAQSGQPLYSSYGYWKETIVPEPSAAALLGLGLLGLYVKKAASR